MKKLTFALLAAAMVITVKADQRPQLAAAVTLGGSQSENGASTVINPRTGEIWMVGSTDSPDFPVTANAFQRQARGKDAYIAKLDPTGRRLLYCTRIGGTHDDSATAIALDRYGNVYVTGNTESSDFPRVGWIYTLPYSSPYKTRVDFFVVKLDSTGKVLYSRTFGGSSDDYANGIAFGSFPTSGDAVYVTGRTYSHDFPVTETAISSRLRGYSDGFVTAIQIGTGAPIRYSTYIGGDGNESAKAVVAQQGNGVNITVTGWTDSRNFPTTSGAWRTSYGGGDADCFVIKINLHTVYYLICCGPNPMASIEYSTLIGGEGEDAGLGLAIDAAGITYVTGYTRSYSFPTTYRCFQPHYGGGYADAFIVKLNSTGRVLYSTYYGGADEDYGRSIALDEYDHAFVAGSTQSLNLPVSRDALQSHKAGGTDGFLVKMSSEGTAFEHATYFGYWNDDWFSDLAFDPSSGALVLVGTSSSGDSSDWDALLVKLIIR